MLSKLEETEALHVQPVRKTRGASSPIYKEAASLLRQLRIDLKSYRDSPDLQDYAERRMRREASLHIRGCVALNAHLDKSGLERGPTPAFYFVPSPMPAAITVEPLPRAEAKEETAYTVRAEEFNDTPKRDTSTSTRREKTAVTTSAAAELRGVKLNSSTLEQKKHIKKASAPGVQPPRVTRYVDPSWSQQHSTAQQEPVRTHERLEEDVTMEAAVRDYLRRMNIIGRNNASPSTVSLFADPLYNGKALCHLAHLILSIEKGSLASLATSGGGRGGEDDVIPVRRHLRVDTVQQNYEAAFASLHQLQSRVLQPSDLLEVSAHQVFVLNHPTALLRLYVKLIAHYLPPPDRLPSAVPQLVWQYSVDSSVASREAYSATAMRQREQALCSFLVDYQVLPDPHTYQLPADDCLVADALNAPYLTSAPHFVARRDAPSALYLPSVFPFLANGTTLCLLAQRLGNKTFAFLSNPRTTKACTANIQKALEALSRMAPSLFSPRMFDEATREVLCGSSDYMVYLLTCVTDALGITRPIERSSQTASFLRRGERGTGTTGNGGGNGHFSNKETAVDGRAMADSAPPRPSSSSPGAEVSQRDVAQLQQWLRDLLGKDFTYRAEDDTFTVAGAQVELREPCLIFSDGVVLAHIVRTLERSRCPSLDCVQPSSRVAAKRFSIKKCLRFLQNEKKATFQFLMLDEHLLKGDVWAVVHLLKTIRSIYKS